MSKSNPHRIHDLNTVYLDFKTVLKLIRSGYRFDDEDAASISDQLEKALELLHAEIKTWKKITRNHPLLLFEITLLWTICLETALLAL